MLVNLSKQLQCQNIMKTYRFDNEWIANLVPQERKSFVASIGGQESESVIEVPVRHRSLKINGEQTQSDQKVCGIGFFSGAGGLDVGAHMAGAKIISSMDFDKDCVETLRANEKLLGSKSICGDIQDQSAKDYKAVIAENNPDKLILIGGPPCQPFSKAGYWVTHEKRLGSEDPRNMIDQYVRMISEIKPDGFLLENVESILHPKNRDAVARLEESIDKLGYHFITYKADAQRFGVPQKRKRVFFIASRKSISVWPKETHGAEEDKFLKPDLLPYERVIDWICKFDDSKYFEPNEVTTGKTYGHELSEIPPGQNYFALTERNGYPEPKFMANKRFWNFLLKLHPLQTSWTLAAQPGPWVGPLHWSNRRLRIPEIAAIQTFPEDYLFKGSRRSVQKQIGNAVPPLLAKAMVDCLMKNI